MGPLNNTLKGFKMDRPEYLPPGKFVQVFLPREIYFDFAKLCLETGKTRQELLLEAIEGMLKERRQEAEEEEERSNHLI